jgi:glycosyltransferase involved in cell wall biosynthesis
MAIQLKAATGLEVICEPYLPSHGAALERIGHSRITIGMGISDGISTTLLEAMTMGSFPILASTSCACEWIADGETGFIVFPHDVAEIARALTTAANDDVLVDTAATRNRAVVEERWDSRKNGPAIIEQYRSLLSGGINADMGVL